MQKEFKKAILFVRVILSILILLLGMYFALTKRYYDTQYNKIASFDKVEVIGLGGKDTIEQKLYFETDNVHSIGICAVNRTSNCVGSFDISLLESGKIIWEQTVEAKDFALQRIVWFNIQQPVEPQKEYIIRMSAEHLSGALYLGGVNRSFNARGVTDNVLRNGGELDISLVTETVARTKLDVKTRLIIAVWSIISVIYIMGFEQLFKNKTRGVITAFLTADLLAVSIYFGFGIKFAGYWNWVLFVGILAAFAVAALLYSILLLKKSDKVELYFAISAIIFGMIYSIIMPPFSAPDEDFHFTEAYRLSNAIMGQPIDNEYRYVYMRECDSGYWEDGRWPDNEYTVDTIKKLVMGDEGFSEKMVAAGTSRNGSYSIAMYIPQAIGITIGRMLHFNYTRVVFLGRYMNFIAFVLITAFAIKLIPSGKWTFFAICQIPLVMEIMSSYSYDALVFAGMMLFVAQLIDMCRNDNKITKKQVFCMALIVSVLLNLKPVYIPFATFAFLIPDDKISSSRHKSIICKTSIACISLIAFMLVYKYDVMSMASVSDKVPRSIGGEAETVINGDMALAEADYYQISNIDLKPVKDIAFMKDNPFDIVESYMSVFLAAADEYILSMFGNYLGWYYVRLPIYVSMLVMLLLYLGYTEDGINAVQLIGYKGKIWTALMMLVSVFAIFFSMYIGNTMPSVKSVGGVQGRYMIPVIMAIPLFLKEQNDSRDKRVSIVMLSLLIQTLSVLGICRSVWN